MILLDTDTLTLLLYGNESIRSRVERMEDDEEIAIAVVTRIEILQGRFDFVLKAADGEQLVRAVARLEESEADLRAFTIISIDESVAKQFDSLRKNKKLKKIGRADLLIACIALAREATLVTRNVRHFQQVPGLKIENWSG